MFGWLSRPGGLRLTLEAGEFLLCFHIIRVRQAHGLNRHLPGDNRVEPLIHRAHGAFAKHTPQLIFPKRIDHARL